MVSRKALNNVGYVTQTPYSWLALAIAAALAIEWWVRPRPLVAALKRSPAYAGALLGILAGAVVALLTEDSGVVMPALMLLAGALPALHLALERDRRGLGRLAAAAEEPRIPSLDPDVTLGFTLLLGGDRHGMDHR